MEDKEKDKLITQSIKIKKRVRRTILTLAFAALAVELFLYLFN
jgi:hypothetical protein|tara:strand:- start:253 stop:381 length:129 start_codon:yes stop_codon:yes gene_type:complete